MYGQVVQYEVTELRFAIRRVVDDPRVDSLGGFAVENGHRAKKPLIGVLASRDSVPLNNSLARLFDNLYEQDPKLLGQFHFVITGGTYTRIIIGSEEGKAIGIEPVKRRTRDFLIPNSTCLPSSLDGGVTILAYLVVHGQVRILWPFLTPLTPHILRPENQSLIRLCDHCEAKRLMNSGSVEEWFLFEAALDTERNVEKCPPDLVLAPDPVSDGDRLKISALRTNHGGYEIVRPAPVEVPESLGDRTIALIAHDRMKIKMVLFARDYSAELAKFGRILSTESTGEAVGEAARNLHSKIYRYNSGPHGGDIEIATEVLYGRCHVVTFFIDTQQSHPHIADIQTLEGTCILQDKVRILPNEKQAREWMERVVKRRVLTPVP